MACGVHIINTAGVNMAVFVLPIDRVNKRASVQTSLQKKVLDINSYRGIVFMPPRRTPQPAMPARSFYQTPSTPSPAA
jgi:hypothetical protein